MNEHKFEPYEQVLVRDIDSEDWIATLYSHYNYSVGYNHTCANGTKWKQCIPYKGNEHLVGTCESPETIESFELGDKVSVRNDVTEKWEKAKFVKHSGYVEFPYVVLMEYDNNLKTWQYCRKGWDNDDK